jgi:transposase-like protein
MSAGYTVTAAAGKMGVDRATLYRWAKSHPEFCNALGVAKAKRVLHWECELLTTDNAARLGLIIAALRMDEPYRRQEPGRELEDCGKLARGELADWIKDRCAGATV